MGCIVMIVCIGLGGYGKQFICIFYYFYWRSWLCAALFLFHLFSLSYRIGNELMPDFFLDEAEKYVEVPSKLASPEDLTPASIFSMIEPLLNERIVHQANATFLFSFSGEHSGHWFLDLKNGSGSITKATENTKADVAFLIDSKVMVELFQGKSNATSAFMSGKLKVVGDMRLAMKLDVLLAQFRGKLKV